MKRIVFGLLFCALALNLSAQTVSEKKEITDTIKTLAPEPYHQTEDLVILSLLKNNHYKKTEINDSMSAVVFDRYIKALDFSKSYFLASDIDSLSRYRYQLDDFIKIGYLKPAYDIFNLFIKRMVERDAYVAELLKNEFDFTVDEYFDTDRKTAPWPKTTAELDEIWRKRMKNEALNEKLNGKDWKTIAETLEKRYRNYQRRMLQLKNEDVFQLYMDQFTETFDPHTQYLSPISSDRFKQDMSLSLEGIGAQLMTEDEYTKVMEIVPGGPAFKSKLLHANDRIIGVAQGEEGEMTDVIGKNIDDVVKLIRGPKGTLVRLQILPADAGVNSKPKIIKIVREKVKLEESAAKKEVIETTLNNAPYKIGVITLPVFYNDFDAQARGEKDYKSTTRDVRRLLRELKDEKIDGLVIDLRNNGGGSLQEAIDMVGLFIKDGPVVQVKNSDGSVNVEKDTDPALVYDGPMAVMVNRVSASASEIFAAAIQDYKRGVIVGEQTYGKGTVQSLIDLNRFIKDPKSKFGQLKLTIAKFYRIDGGSTQRRGVIPDIQYPAMLDSTEYSESMEPSSLPWDQIPPASYEPYEKMGNLLSVLNEKHEERMKNNPEFLSLLETIKEHKEDRKKKTVSLLESARKKERDEEEQKKLERENLGRQAEGLKLLKKGEVAPKEEKQHDFLLKETANVVTDMFISQKAAAK